MWVREFSEKLWRVGCTPRAHYQRTPKALICQTFTTLQVCLQLSLQLCLQVALQLCLQLSLQVALQVGLQLCLPILLTSGFTTRPPTTACGSRQGVDAARWLW